MENLGSRILQSVKTVQDREELLGEIDFLMLSLFKKNPNALKRAVLLTSLRFKEALEEEIFPIQNRELVKKYLLELSDKLKNLKTLKLILSFTPRQSTIDAIYSWGAANLGPGIILDTEVDREILGGAIAVFNGKRADMSLRKKIDELLKTNREKILSLIFP